MTHEVMIQDVNPPNALIYLDGYMYVGAREHLARPSWFAPYFTLDCADSGLFLYGSVVDVVEVKVADLQKHPKRPLRLNAGILNHRNWPRWARGLAAIAYRSREETATLHWTSHFDDHRLYFLEAPKALGRTIKKAGQRQLPYGYGCSYADLMSMADLSERGRP